MLMRAESEIPDTHVSPPHESAIRLPVVVGEEENVISYCKALKQVLRLAIPYSLAQLLRLVGDSATVYIMAVAGEDELAATGLIDSVQYVFFNTALISLVSVAISAGKEKGKGNHAQVGLVFRQGLIFGGLISLPFLGVSPFAESLLVATGQPRHVARIAGLLCY